MRTPLCVPEASIPLGRFLAALLRPGGQAAEFRKAFAAALGPGRAYLTSSGRSALQLILHALKVEAGAEIVVAAYNAPLIPNLLCRWGFRPVFADVHPGDFTIDVAAADSVIGPRTAGILALHTEGVPCRIHELRRIADKRGIFLIEDCAHACGAVVGGQPVGTFGDAALFSLGKAKLVSAVGGGAAFFPEERGQMATVEQRACVPGRLSLARRGLGVKAVEISLWPLVLSCVSFPLYRLLYRLGLDLLHLAEDPGTRKDGLFGKPGTYRTLHDAQGAVGLYSLESLERRLAKRSALASLYDRLLDGVVPVQSISTPGDVPSPLAYTILVPEPARFIAFMLAKRTLTQRSWLKCCAESCHAARRIGEQAVYLPLHERMSEQHTRRVAGDVIEFMGQ